MTEILAQDTLVVEDVDTGTHLQFSEVVDTGTHLQFTEVVDTGTHL